jgi:hypothetical protein
MLARIWNTGRHPAATQAHPAMCAQTVMYELSGRDTLGVQGVVDVMGPPSLVLVQPDSALAWVVPLHWLAGRAGASQLPSLYAFAPGNYRAGISLRGCRNAEQLRALDAWVSIRVVAPDTQQARVQLRLHQRLDAALAAARATGRPDSAMRVLYDALRDPDFTPYFAYLVLDFASGLEGSLGGYSPTLALAIDSLRLARLSTLSAEMPTAVRLAESLADHALDTLALNALAPSLRRLVLEQRAARRRQ